MKFIRFSSVLLIGILVILSVLPITVFADIEIPDTAPSINSVYVYSDLLEAGDRGVLIDYFLDYAVLPVGGETATEAYLAVFIDQFGAQIKSAAPYTYVDSGYGRGLIWLYFTAAEATTNDLVIGHIADFEVWLVGNPTLSWEDTGVPTTAPKTVATIDYWQTTGDPNVLLALRVLYYADQLELIWVPTLDLVEITGLGNRLTSPEGESYFENVITNLRLMAPSAFSASSYDPITEDIDYSTSFGAIIDNDTGTVMDMLGGGAPITLHPTYNAGTAQFTNGSPTVVGTDVYWTSDMVGMSIQHTVDAVWYTIVAVPDSAYLTLSVNYADAGGTTHAYTIQNIVDVTVAGDFTVTLSKGTAGTIESLFGGGVVTDSPVNLVPGNNTITASNAGTGNILINVYQNDTAASQEDEVTGTGFDLTDLGLQFGMSRWFISGIVWMALTVVICAAVYGMTDKRGVAQFGGGPNPATKVIMLVFDFCIIAGALLGLLHPIVAALMFIGFGVLTGYVLFYRQANF